MSDNWKTTVYGVLSDAETQKPYVNSNAQGEYQLPSFEFENRVVWLNDYATLQTRLSELFSCKVNILRRIYIEEDFDTKIATAAFAVELAEDFEPVGSLLKIEDLESTEQIQTDSANIIKIIHPEIVKGKDIKGRPAWAEAGWHESISAWIHSTLAEQGYIVKDIILVKTWNISCVLRIVTDHGDVYFKANYNFPLFADEAKLYAFLRKSFPLNTPEIIFHDVETGYLLIKACTFATKGALYENQNKLLTQAFEFHKAYVDKKDNVLAIPCADRSLEFMPEQLAKVLEDDYVKQLANQDDLDYLADNFSTIEKSVKELAQGAIPHTLIHGDLHMGNVAFDGDNTVFLDWTDASYSHPFFDAIHDIYFWDDRAIADKLRDEYLNLWVKHLGDVSYDELLRLWNLATPLYLMQRVITDHSFVENMEMSSQYEFRDGCVWFLSQAVEKLQSL